MNTISLKLPDRLLELLEAESRARDLAGSVKGLPCDLATNRKYLEGFGR